MRALSITNSITRRDQKSLEKYLNEISKFDVLTPDQEYELFQDYANGSEVAFEKIIRHNLRFVVSVAKQYQNSGLWLGDLVNEGNIGLIKAAQRFDVTKGFKFISYAVWWIRQSIIQALSEKARKIRIPANHYTINSKISKVTDKYLQKFERIPNIDELAAETGVSEVLINKNSKAYKKCQSLDAPISDDSYTSLGSLIEDTQIKDPDFNLAVKGTQKEQVKFLLDRLSPREASVVSLFFGIGRKFPMSLDDISYLFGISKERVRQIKDKSIIKLRSRHREMVPAF